MQVEVFYNEQELLQQVAAGDEHAFSTLYERYHYPLYRNVFRLVQSEEETKDIIQEIFISLWENRARLSADRPINGWLFTLSYNKSVNYLKKKLRQEAKTDLGASIAEEPQDAELPDIQWQLLEEAVSRLSPRKRRVFELCKLEGKTYDQAALELGLSKHTVGEYLQDAMAFIREYVRQHPSYGASALALFVTDLFFS